jgi:MFS family permease
MKKLYTLYILILTQGLSLIGSRMTGIAMGIWLFQEKGSTTYLLLVPFFNELPAMIGGSLAGILVDRWKRKVAFIVGDAGQAAGTLLLLVSLATGRFKVWHLYGVVMLQGIFSMIQGPAANATTTMLVPKEHRERANAIKEMTFPVAGVVAPVLSGLLYIRVGIKGVIFIDLTTFVVSVVVLLFLHIPEPQVSLVSQDYGGSFWEDAMGGFRYLIHRKVLFGLVIYYTFMNFLLNGPLELAVPYLIRITNSEEMTSMLLGVMSGGALVGALAIALWGGTRPRIHTLMWGMILNGLMLMIFGIVRTPLFLAGSLFLLMIPLSIGNTLMMSILQIKTPPDMQGRMFAAFSQMSYVTTPVSFLLTGQLVDKILEPAVGQPAWKLAAWIFGEKLGAGMGLLLTTTGALILISTIAIYGKPSIRKLEQELPDYEVSEEEKGSK